MAERKTFQVTSNHGVFTVFADDGSVKEVALEDNAKMPSISKFDVDEWQKTYPDEDIVKAGSVDILDLGYWYRDKSEIAPEKAGYEPPVDDWRAEFAAGRHAAHPGK